MVITIGWISLEFRAQTFHHEENGRVAETHGYVSAESRQVRRLSRWARSYSSLFHVKTPPIRQSNRFGCRQTSSCKQLAPHHPARRIFLEVSEILRDLRILTPSTTSLLRVGTQIIYGL